MVIESVEDTVGAAVPTEERHRWRPRARARLAGAAALALGLVAPLANPASALGSPSGFATVAAFGTALLGAPPASAPAVVGIAFAPGGTGYYVLRANGGVDNFDAPWYGSEAGRLPAGVSATGIAVDPATGGYWITTSAGNVDNFHAPWYGSDVIPSGGWGQYPAAVGIVATPTGSGYDVLRANGGVDNFHAAWYGSLASSLPYGATAPVTAVGIALDPATGGYWILTSDGGVANFHAPWYGSPKASSDPEVTTNPVVGIAPGAGGIGYDVLRANGGVDNFDAPWYGSEAGRLPAGASATGIAVDPATGGYLEAVDFTPLGPYRNPLRGLSALVPQEIDQGVDACGSGPVYAIGPGVVVDTENPGWPGGAFIAYRLTSGPAEGLFVYVAENLTPTVAVGETVGAATVVGELHDSGTCMETGWADGTPPYGLAAAYAEFNGKNSTAYGRNFSALLVALGARPGLPQDDGPPGPIPSWWPSWS